MIMGVDGSRAGMAQKTGTENYSDSLIMALLNNDCHNDYVLYLRNNLELPVNSHNRVSKRIINLPRLWTQVGLALEVTFRPPDLLFIPAHTLPVMRPPSLKTVVTIHDLGYEYLEQYHKFPGRLYLNKSTEYAVKNATHLIAVSQATKNDLVNKLGAASEKITVIHEGLDTNFYKQSLRSDELNQSLLLRNKPAAKTAVKTVKEKYHLGEYLLFVGTVQPRKNLENIVRAYAGVSSKIKSDLVISGKKGWLDEKLYQLPKDLGLGDRVRFLGYTESPDMPALYSGAEALIFPSLFEGFGLPILEAFACGTPVLTSNVSSMPEVAGEAALLVNPNDIESISQGILQMTSNNILRNQLRRKGLERVKEFTWDKAAKETIDIFKRVIENK